MKAEMRRIGILGGTFDPIHHGHLAIADTAKECLGLHRIIIIPTGQPWLKAGQSVTEPKHRLEMARLAVRGRPGFDVSAIEVDRVGPTYTVDTLGELRQDLGDTAAFYLVLGMDSIRELGRWRDPDELFRMSVLVGLSRPEVPDVSAAELIRTYPHARGRFRMIDGPMLQISATEIRLRVAGGLPISGLVPQSVEEYIRDQRLYSQQ